MHALPNLSPRTRAWYAQKVEGPLKPQAKLPVDRIDREAARATHERLTRKVGPYGANGAMRVLKLLLNDVARTHDLSANPVSRGVRMNKAAARDWAIPPDGMPLAWRQLDALEDPVRRGCWVTLLMTGLRSHDARSVPGAPRGRSGRQQLPIRGPEDVRWAGWRKSRHWRLGGTEPLPQGTEGAR